MINVELKFDITQVEPGSAYNNARVAFDPEVFEIYSWEQIGSGTPADVFHGIHLDICKIPLCISKAGIAQLIDALNDHVEFLQEVADEHQVLWDGSNHRGKIPEDLQDSWQQFCEHMHKTAINAPSVWSARDWFGSAQSEICSEVSSLPSVESFSAWITDQIAYAASDGVELQRDDVREETLCIVARYAREEWLEPWLVEAL